MVWQQEADDAPAEAARKKSETREMVIGVLLAVYIGIANGSFTVPFKYAQKDVKGIVYVVSFGLGAVMVRPLSSRQPLLARRFKSIKTRPVPRRSWPPAKAVSMRAAWPSVVLVLVKTAANH